MLMLTLRAGAAAGFCCSLSDLPPLQPAIPAVTRQTTSARISTPMGRPAVPGPQSITAVPRRRATLPPLKAPRSPGLDLAYLRRLRKLEALSDEQMVNQLRTHLFDASAPNPSVETLLHAFLPHTFIDHTHADAILALTNQPDGAELIRKALGK